MSDSGNKLNPVSVRALAAGGMVGGGSGLALYRRPRQGDAVVPPLGN